MAGALCLLAALVAGCSAGRVVFPVTVEPGGLPMALDAGHPTTPEVSVRHIARLVAHDLGLPVPAQFTLYMYSSSATFASGLMRDAYLSAPRAAELSEFAVGIAKRGRLLLNTEGGSDGNRDWVRVVAHELTHLAQFELADGEGHGEQWLAEGLAEWVAFTVLERLGLDTLEQCRASALAGIRDHVALTEGRLDLDTLGTPGGFTSRQLREGSRATYQLVFLITDYLITREGLPQVQEYFRTFKRSRGRRLHVAFERAFGQSLAAFELEVLAHLKAVAAG